ncbi:Gldg family protein [Sphingorhabdus arenilitoris]|uniref:Gldg family protein n=1 Tax=Sphingorhabdus arenilitoris TaxID=1490041 RepID=A0ABV8RED6_9SPHN
MKILSDFLRLHDRRVLTAAILLLLLVPALILMATGEENGEEKQHKLGLMTTLPLYWSGAGFQDMVQSSSAPAPAYERLDAKYQIKLLDAADKDSLKSVHMLLLAQSRALSPMEFVDLDQWVRSGGHVLILADPALQWESGFPLGDKRRPLFTSLLSPLFSHWGLELALPIDEGSEEDVIKKQGSFQIRTVTPGIWAKSGKNSSAKCIVSDDAFVARCNIGKGSAILVADADFLNADTWSGSGMRLLSGDDDFDNMTWTESLLDQLWHHDAG